MCSSSVVLRWPSPFRTSIPPSSVCRLPSPSTSLDLLATVTLQARVSAKTKISACVRNMPGDSERGGVTLEDLKEKMALFAKERDWDQFHSPRNLLLAMVGEVGEVSEVFQWKGEVPRGLGDWEDKEKVHLGEELSDVLLYLVRLADVCGIDLGKATLSKLEHNSKKYPVQVCKGSSQNYFDIHNNYNKK